MTQWADEKIVDALLAERHVLHGLARSLLGDADLAEDVVQEAIADVARQRTLHSRRGLLARIVRRRASNLRRERARRARREREVGRPAQPPSPGQMAAERELCQRVGDAVLALEEPYRTTVWMRFFDGHRPKEVARRMGVPVTTVRTRLARALEKLRRSLDRAYGERRAWYAAVLTCLVRGAPAPIPWGAVQKALVAGILVVAAGALVLGQGNDLQPPEQNGITETSTEASPADHSAEREAIASLPPEAPEELLFRGRLEHDDGTPVSGVRFWIWGEVRPRDFPPTEILTNTPEIPQHWPPVAGATDAAGHFAVRPRADVRAITFAVSDAMWATYEVGEEAPGFFALPRLRLVTLSVDGLGPGEGWSLGISCAEGNAARVDMPATTRSGTVTLGLAPRYLSGTTSQRRIEVVAGVPYRVQDRSQVLELEPNEIVVDVGNTVAFRVAHRRPALEIRLLDPTGALAKDVPALVMLHDPETRFVAHELDGGRVIVRPVEGSTHVSVLTDDGELFQQPAPPPGKEGETVSLTFWRGEGRASWRFALPEGTGPEDVKTFLYEGSTGRMRSAPRFQATSFLDGRSRAPADEAAWSVLSNGDLVLQTLDGTWSRVQVHLIDGRIAGASFPGGRARGSRPVPLEPTPSQLCEPVDLREIVEKYGAKRGNIVWQLLVSRGSGVADYWTGTRVFRFEPWTLDFPTWSMHIPEGLQARVRLWDYDSGSEVYLPPPPVRDAGR